MSRLEVAVDRGALLQFYEAIWGPMYESVLTLLGNSGTIIPMGDPKQGQPNATTFNTVGDEQVAFTWSEAPSLFDSSLDLTDPDSFQGIIPVVSFNGTDEEADTPDAAFWTQDDGAASEDVSVGAWVNLSLASSTQTVLAKWDSTSTREWAFQFDPTENLRLIVMDESQAVDARRIADAASTTGWHFVVATYDGTGGATAADGITLYEDGAVKASTATTNGSYVAMEDGAAPPSVGRLSATDSSYLASILAGGPLGPFHTRKVLSGDEVRRLYEVGRRALTV